MVCETLEAPMHIDHLEGKHEDVIELIRRSGLLLVSFDSSKHHDGRCLLKGATLMSPELLHYRSLTEELLELRSKNEGADSPEEDALLDQMDRAWDDLSEADVRAAEEYQTGPDGSKIHEPKEGK